MKSTLISTCLAVAVAPFAGFGLNSLTTTPQTSPPAFESQELAKSLVGLNSTLASFQAKQAGSELELATQINQLAQAVASTQQANQDQISQLSAALQDVKAVATQPQDTSAFKQMLENFGTSLEKRMDTKIDSLQKVNLQTEGVGTLDVENNPDNPQDDGRPQDFADAARRVVALEKEIAELKKRSTVQSSSYYPAVSGVSSGGSTGSFAGGSTGSYATANYGSTGSTYVSGYNGYAQYQPVSYETTSYQPPVANVRQTVSRPRGIRGWFSGNSNQCYTVNGVTYCP